MLSELSGLVKGLKTIERIAVQEAMNDALKDNDFMKDLIDRYPLEFILAVNTVKNGDNNLIYSKYNGGSNFELFVRLEESILSTEAQTNINVFIDTINKGNATFDDNYIEVYPFLTHDDEIDFVKFVEKRIDTNYDWFSFSEQWFVTDLFIKNIDAIINALKENYNHFNGRFTIDWDDMLEYYEVFNFEGKN
jgi:hypothetical protein